MVFDTLVRDLAAALEAVPLIDPHSHIDPLHPAAKSLDDILGYHYYTELAHSAGMSQTPYRMFCAGGIAANAGVVADQTKFQAQKTTPNATAIAAVANALGSEQAGPVPFVQPGPPTSPLAFDQPPAYQAQSMPLADSSSPIVGVLWGGSRLAAGVPGENG